MAKADFSEGLERLLSGVAELKTQFPHRRFTLDGRLVGDIGEAIASENFGIILDATPRSTHQKSRPRFDAVTIKGGLNVQIKATFQDALTFKEPDGLYLGLKLGYDGSFETIFNGPARVIYDHYNGNRKGLGEKLLRFPNHALKELNGKVEDPDRVPLL